MDQVLLLCEGPLNILLYFYYHPTYFVYDFKKKKKKVVNFLCAYPSFAKNNQIKTNSNSNKFFPGRHKIGEKTLLSKMGDGVLGQRERRSGSKGLWMS